MTATTLAHVPQDLPSLALLPDDTHTTSADVPEIDPERLRVLTAGCRPHPDPEARDRYAALLYRITGWETFADEEGERAYVSRLWGEDWDSPEDSVYDEQ